MTTYAYSNKNTSSYSGATKHTASYSNANKHTSTYGYADKSFIGNVGEFDIGLFDTALFDTVLNYLPYFYPSKSSITPYSYSLKS